MAYIVENDLLCHAALKELNGCDTVDVKFNTKIKTCQYQNDEEIVRICLENGEIITCNLLVSLKQVHLLTTNSTFQSIITVILLRSRCQ